MNNKKEIAILLILLAVIVVCFLKSFIPEKQDLGTPEAKTLVTLGEESRQDGLDEWTLSPKIERE